MYWKLVGEMVPTILKIKGITAYLCVDGKGSVERRK